MFWFSFLVVFYYIDISECTRSTNCTLEVKPTSGQLFLRTILTNNTEYASIQIQFNNSKNVTFLPDIIMPGKWVWTRPPINYLYWPIDFKILSLGLLSFNTLPTSLTLEMEAPNCTLEIGTNETDYLIGETLLNFTLTIKENLIPFDLKIKDYLKRSKWCYFYKHNDLPLYSLVIRNILSYPIYSVAYKCCRQKKIYHQSSRKIQCGKVYSTQEQVISWPYVLGIIFMIFFPVGVFQFAAKAVKSGASMPEVSKLRYDYINCQCTDGVVNFESEEEETMGFKYKVIRKDRKKSWVFLDKHYPISVTNYFLSLFTLGTSRPVLASRIRRIIFLLMIPSVIYTMVFSYYLHMDEFIKSLIKAKVPIGMLSLLGNIQNSIGFCYPTVGGSYILLFTYHLIGFLIICLPSDLGAVLERGLPRDCSNFRLLLTVDNATLEKKTFFKFVNCSGFEKLYRFFFAKHLFFFRPKNWCFCIKFQIKRWQLFKENNSHQFQKEKINVCIIKILGVFYTFACIIELLVTLVIFLCPILSFIYVSFKGYCKFIQCKTNNKLFWLLGLLCSIGCSIFLVTFCIILISSFSFLGKVFTFVLIAILVNPMCTFAYILFAFSMMYYFHNLCKSFKLQYYILLKITTEKAIDAEINNIYENNLETPLEYRAKYIQDQFNSFNNTGVYRHKTLYNFNPMFRLVRYVNFCPGIPRDLYDNVVDELRPVYIYMLWFVLRLSVICITLLWSLEYISKFGSTSFELLHILTIIGINACPRFIQIIFERSFNYMPEEDVHKIEFIVQQYMKK